MVVDQSNQIAIYRSKSGRVKLKIKLEKETIWLTQLQIAYLFNVDRSVVTKHLGKIFRDKELTEGSNVQKMHIGKSDKPVKVYSLDTVISVGYRINSFRATRFRIWATQTLKQYITKGYVLNRQRLRQQQRSLKILSDSVALIKSKLNSPLLANQESELFEIIKSYIDSLRLLKQYDDQQIIVGQLASKSKFLLDYQTAVENVNLLKTNLIKRHLASDNFGLENSHKFHGLIGAINQTFANKDLYPSIEEKGLYLQKSG